MTAPAPFRPAVCSECGTPADIDIRSNVRARATFIPLLIVALLLASIVAASIVTWSPAPLVWNTSQDVSNPFPIPTLNSVAELQSLLDDPVVPSTRLRDALLHELQNHKFEFYEPSDGDLQVTLSKSSGSVTNVWWIGWPISVVTASHRFYYSDIHSKRRSAPPPYHSTSIYAKFSPVGLFINAPYRGFFFNVGWLVLITAVIWSLWPLIRRLRVWTAERAPLPRTLLRLFGVLLVLTIAITAVWPTVTTSIDYDPHTTTAGAPVSPFSREYHSTGLTRSAAIERLKVLPNDAAVARELFSTVNGIALNAPDTASAIPMLAVFNAPGITNSAVIYGWPTPIVTITTETWPSIAPESRTVQLRRGKLEMTTRSTANTTQRTIISVSLTTPFILLTYLALAWHITRLLVRRHLTTRAGARRALEHCISCNYPLTTTTFDGSPILTLVHHRREARTNTTSDHTSAHPPPPPSPTGEDRSAAGGSGEGTNHQ